MLRVKISAVVEGRVTLLGAKGGDNVHFLYFFEEIEL